MFDIVNLQVKHLAQMAEEPMNEFVKLWPPEVLKSWEESGRSFSGFVNGQLMVCVGLAEYWDGRAHIWAVFSERAERPFVAVFRGMQKFLDSQPYRRLEMDIPIGKDFTEVALRRARLLGFEVECYMAKHYLPSGNDAILLSRVRED